MPHTHRKTDGWYRLEFPVNKNVKQIKELLLNNTDIDDVNLNYYGKLSGDPNDSYWGGQWALSLIEMPSAWDLVEADSSILVGIIDSRINDDHEDIDGNIWVNPYEIINNSTDDWNTYEDDINGWNFINNSNDISYQSSTGDYHGTRVSGIIGARSNNNQGIAGIAGGWSNQSGVKLIGLNVVSQNGINQENARDAIIYLTGLAQQGHKVIANMSINFYYENDNDHTCLKSAVETAIDNGVIIVNSAGNRQIDDQSNPYYNASVSVLPIPARWSGVIAVGASHYAADTTAEGKSSYSLYEEDDTNLLIVAPVDSLESSEVGIYTTYSGDSYVNSFNGTSAAAPIISGVIALMLSANQCLSNNDIIDILKATAVKIGSDSYVGGRTSKLGYGRVDAAAAVQSALEKLSFTVGLGGNKFLLRGQSATFTASVTGGTGTNTYQWYRKESGSSTWSPYGTSSNQSFTMINSDFDIKVVVENCDNTEELIKTVYLVGGGASPKPDNQNMPNYFLLNQNHPNPFNPTTTIKYELPEPSSVRLVVYDLRGNELKTWENSNESPGFKQINWQAIDSHGNKVPAGIYIYKLTATSHETNKVFSKSMKMVLLK